MSVFEIIGFIAQTMNGIINAFDNVYIANGSYSILDIFVSLLYLKITFWGVFSLISYKKGVNTIDE